MKATLIASIIFLVSFSACSQSGVRNIAATELESAMKNKIVLIDVRTPEEYKSGHLTNAVNIDWYDPGFLNKMQQINKQTPVYLYCRSGSRSLSAAHKLSEAGFTKIYSLQGGIIAWQNSGKPLQK